MKIDKKFGDKIYVEWNDAYSSDNSWVSFENAIEIPEEVFCKTSGFFVHKTKDYLIIANTVGNTKEDDIGGVLYIPRKWINKVI
jgi:hypothetical protein